MSLHVLKLIFKRGCPYMYSTLTSDGPEMNREITGYLLSCKTTCTCVHVQKKVHVQVPVCTCSQYCLMWQQSHMFYKSGFCVHEASILHVSTPLHGFPQNLDSGIHRNRDSDIHRNHESAVYRMPDFKKLYVLMRIWIVQWRLNNYNVFVLDVMNMQNMHPH